MMWKPTKEGVYLHGGEYSRVMYPSTLSITIEPAPRYCPDDFNPVATCPDDWRRWQGRLTPVPDGPWSLLAPDWQPGAPTVAQLERWQWWALQYDDCLVVGTTLADEDFGTVKCSAPVQFDLSNGPLWVPLEVCK